MALGKDIKFIKNGIIKLLSGGGSGLPHLEKVWAIVVEDGQDTGVFVDVTDKLSVMFGMLGFDQDLHIEEGEIRGFIACNDSEYPNIGFGTVGDNVILVHSCNEGGDFICNNMARVEYKGENLIFINSLPYRD